LALAEALFAAVLPAEAFAAVFGLVRVDIVFLFLSRDAGKRNGPPQRCGAALRPPNLCSGAGCREHPPVGSGLIGNRRPTAIFRKYNGNCGLIQLKGYGSPGTNQELPEAYLRIFHNLERNQPFILYRD
jgi:hypothetical protein